MEQSEVLAEIARHMPVEDFLRIQDRLAQLRQDEEQKLQALAQLQQFYLAAATDADREKVRVAVADIREISKKTRQEIRALNTELSQHMPLDQARDLFQQLQNT